MHIDLKSSISLTEVYHTKVSKIFTYKKISVRWADYSQVKCELYLLEKAVKNNYSYYHLISGVDFPLKTAREIHSFFEKNNGKEFVHIQSYNIPESKKDWLKYYYVFRKLSRDNIFFKMLEKISLKLQYLFGVNRLKKNTIRISTGANWFSITHKFAIYVLKEIDKYAIMFRNTRSSDEIFMQTILVNSEFINNRYSNKYNDMLSNMRYIDWKRGNPYTFVSNDYDLLINSELMFARKFSENKDYEIVKLLFNYLKNKQ